MLLTNYFKLALRSIRNHPGSALLNLVGLAMSMAAALVILLFVRHELSFDTFHEDAPRIYRLNEIQSFTGITPQHVALSMYPMGPALMEDYPEVESFARIAGAPQTVSIDGELRLVERPIRVDPAFFTLFDFPVRAGDPAAGLADPFAIVLTESTAQTLFGTADAMGRELIVGENTYHVAAILAPFPGPSHLEFDAVFSMKENDDERNMQNWGSNWLVTYLRLAEGASASDLDSKLPEFTLNHMGEERSQAYELYLQPLLDVHLGSAHMTHDYRNWRKFDRRYVYMFALLGGFLLVVAGINFMNLTTARSAARAKEVGVRKAIGARRTELASQFLSESLVMAFASLVLAVGLAMLALPFVNQLSQRDIPFTALFAWPLPVWLLGATLGFGLLAGVYPAFVLSAFRPVLALKGATSRSGRKTPFRNVLVVFQFAIAMALIVGTVLTVRQFRYMQQRDIGFNKEHVLVVPMSRMANTHYEALKQTLLAAPGVLGVTASNQRLGNNLHQWGTRAETEAGETIGLSISNIVVDYNYLDFYGMDLKEGRWFSEERGTDLGRARVVNEAMVAEMGWTHPLGMRIGFGGDDTLGTVIGVARDFNFNSLHNKVEPLAMSVQDFGYDEASIRIDPAMAREAITAVERIWTASVTDRPFDYSFLDEHLSELYRTDQQVSEVVAIVAGFAIFIACLGLFGLAAVTTEQRTKEIGIRKALGATIPQLLMLLSKEYLRLVAVAFVIASPIAFVLMRSWLAEYPYRIDIGFGVFVLAGVLTLVIALGTISYRSLAAARSNPVDTLRYE
ncbi:MAG: FtsX-like permease family protein [Rhodothermales bacterium]